MDTLKKGLKRALLGRRYEIGTPYVLGGSVSLLSLAIVGTFGFATYDGAQLGTQNLAAVISSVLVTLVNTDRDTNSLGGLTINPVLTAAAQAKADDMATKSYFAHISPDGKNSWYWFRAAGYSFTYAGENLAVDFSDSNDVERAWMNSPTHRANILNGHYTEIGIATAQGMYQGRTTTFVVQMFGAPSKTATLPIQSTTLPKNPTELAVATAGTSSKPAAVLASTTPVATTQAPVLGASVAEASAPFWAYLVAAPKTSLMYVYYFLSLLVFVLLGFVTRFELRRHHVRHFKGAAFLFVLMIGLVVATNFVFLTGPVLTAGVAIGVY